MANGTSPSSTSYAAAGSKRTFMEGSSFFSLASAAKGGPDLGREPLQLGELIVAHEPDTEVADSSRSIPSKRREHHVGGAEAHRTARVHASTIVGGEEFLGDALGLARIVLHTNRRVHAEREAGAGATVARQRLLGALAHEPALLGVHVRRDDAVAEPAEPIELGGEHLAAVRGRDEDGGPGRIPRQRPDGVVGQGYVAVAIGHRLAAPQPTPDLDVVFEAPDTALVGHAARRPLALGRGQAPADAEAEHQSSAGGPIHVGDLA